MELSCALCCAVSVKWMVTCRMSRGDIEVNAAAASGPGPPDSCASSFSLKTFAGRLERIENTQ